MLTKKTMFRRLRPEERKCEYCGLALNPDGTHYTPSRTAMKIAVACEKEQQANAVKAIEKDQEMKMEKKEEDDRKERKDIQHMPKVQPSKSKDTRIMGYGKRPRDTKETKED